MAQWMALSLSLSRSRSLALSLPTGLLCDISLMTLCDVSSPGGVPPAHAALCTSSLEPRQPLRIRTPKPGQSLSVGLIQMSEQAPPLICSPGGQTLLVSPFQDWPAVENWVKPWDSFFIFM